MFFVCVYNMCSVLYTGVGENVSPAGDLSEWVWNHMTTSFV